MALRCNKCHQGEPYLGDTWCLCCSSVEALAGELKCGWGNQATRVLATDVLTTAVRQLRALRRLGLAGAGSARATTPEKSRKAPSAPPEAQAADESRAAPGAEASAPPAAPPPEKPVKEEDKRSETDGGEASEYSEDEEEETELETDRVPGLKAVPKAASEKDRSEIPRRRVQTGRSRSREAGDIRAHGNREDRSRRRESDGHRHESRSHRTEGDREHPRPRSRSRRRQEEREPERPRDGQKKRKKRHGHRGGTKHQKLHRAREDPYRRFHHKQPGSFWDNPPSPH